MKKAFTLVEIMLVVVVIGILLAIMLPRVGRMVDKSREKACRKNLQNIQSAVTTYCVRPNDEVYPTSNDEFRRILDQYFPQGIPLTTLRRSLEGMDSNAVYVGSQTADITDVGGWFLITNEESPDAGRVFINSLQKDLYGAYYSSYPSW
ncbi:MAG: type II secretion system protein [bacterium]